MNTLNENTQANENIAPEATPIFITVPAKVCVQIGKRKRYFDTEDEARAALEKFNTGGTTNKGIRAAQLVAKALKAERLALIKTCIDTDLTDKTIAQHANILYGYCLVKPELCEILTGTVFPIAMDVLVTESVQEPATEPVTEPATDPEVYNGIGSQEIVDPEPICEDTDAFTESRNCTIDPLADLLG